MHFQSFPLKSSPILELTCRHSAVRCWFSETKGNYLRSMRSVFRPTWSPLSTLSFSRSRRSEKAAIIAGQCVNLALFTVRLIHTTVFYYYVYSVWYQWPFGISLEHSNQLLQTPIVNWNSSYTKRLYATHNHFSFESAYSWYFCCVFASIDTLCWCVEKQTLIWGNYVQKLRFSRYTEQKNSQRAK